MRLVEVAVRGKGKEEEGREEEEREGEGRETSLEGDPNF